MKEQFKKVLFVELVLLILASVQFLILKNNTLLLLIEFTIIGGIIYKLFSIDKREERVKKDLLLLILIVTISYYVITYFVGFFIGFIYSNYSRSIFGILRNTVIYSLLILIIETTRERIIKNAKYYKSLVILSILIFCIIEITTQITFNNIHSRVELLEFIMVIVIPMITKNIFLTFSTYYTDKSNSTIYNLIMTVPNFILPVFPDLGDYISTLLLTALPLLLLALAHKMFFYKREKITDSKSHVKYTYIQRTVSISLIIILLVLVYLVGGFGRFSALAIGSKSMTGAINKGDVIIIDKKKKEYKKKDIIAFSQDGEVIVHRIVDITKKDNKIYYQTKGDANNGEDPWLVDTKSVIGQEKVRILFFGLPTVALSELIHK